MKRNTNENKIVFLIWFVSLVLITISIFTSPILSIAALLIMIISFVFLSPEKSLVLLFGILPYANIFKYKPETTSFFTIAEILLVLILVIKIKKIKLFPLSCLIILFGYTLITSANNLNLLLIIKVFSAFLLIYYSVRLIKINDFKQLTLLLTISTIITLILSNNSWYFSFLSNYFSDLNYYNDGFSSSNIVRSSGFMGDPNYCAMLIIVVITILCVLYYHKDIGNIFWLFIVLLVPLGMLTYSKSYFLCLVVLVFLMIIFVIFPKHKVWAVCCLAIVPILAFFVFSGKFESVNMILDRFNADDITTGRNDLNIAFLNHIVSSPSNLILGSGIGSSRIVGVSNTVHNIYIELFYKYGLLGSSLFILTLFSLFPRRFKTTKYKVVNFFPLCFVVIMYFFLAGIEMFEFPFYIILSFVSLNYKTSFNKTNMNIIGCEV